GIDERESVSSYCRMAAGRLQRTSKNGAAVDGDERARTECLQDAADIGDAIRNEYAGTSPQRVDEQFISDAVGQVDGRAGADRRQRSRVRDAVEESENCLSSEGFDGGRVDDLRGKAATNA